MSYVKKGGVTGQMFLDSFMSSLALQSSEEVGVVEFTEDIIFNGNISLHPAQKAVYKAFYNEPLTLEEKDILLSWKNEEGPYGVARTNWVEGRHYTTLAMEVGRRGSKSVAAAVFTLYEFYRLIMLDNPAAHYGLLPSDPIAIFMFANTYEQCKKTIFSKITGWVRESNFFNELIKAGRIEVLMGEIRCVDKNVSILAAHTNSKALVGYSLKLMVCDEFARWDNDDDGHNKGMQDIWKNVGKGVSTFKEHGKKIAISSAWAEGDNIQKLIQDGTKLPNRLTFTLPTWYLNPDFNLDVDVIKEDYIEDPENAALEYEGIRSKSTGNFFNYEEIEDRELRQSSVDMSPYNEDVTSTAGTRNYVSLKLHRVAKFEGPSYAHIDLGVKKDSAALCICHAEDVDGKLVVVVDGYGVWKPGRDENGIKRVVNFSNVYDVAMKIAKGRKISLLTFDSFQSQQAIQEFHKKGIRTKEMATSRKAQWDYFCQTRNLIKEKRIIFPSDDRWSLLAKRQFALLTEVKSTNVSTFKHGPIGKDLIDAIVNAVYSCSKEREIGLYSSSNKIAVGKRPTLTERRNVKLTSKHYDAYRMRRKF